MARFETLTQWLTWQETLHPQAIDLGLERLREVLQRLGWGQPSAVVITVGGTNGKGSSVAFLEACLQAGGYRVGSYTSPHLLSYNERIRINGVQVADEAICRAFAHIDSARGDISLTYFEFGTLAALEIFRETQVDVMVLEVGLGGRLDAVNVLDADAALITSIDIDHVEWLGPDRESIGHEKAGIYRSGRPAICADPLPPSSLLEHARKINASLYRYGQDYGFNRQADTWTWWDRQSRWESLPLPALIGTHQLENAAGTLMTLATLAERVPLTPEAIRVGLRQAQIGGRFQVVPGSVEWIFDVTHNPHGAAILARCLKERPCFGRTWAVLGMLVDKDIVGVSQALTDLIDHWYVTGLQGPRRCTGEQLAATLKKIGISEVVSAFPGVDEACRAAAQEAAPGDRIVVFGSFYTVAAAQQAGWGTDLKVPSID